MDVKSPKSHGISWGLFHNLFGISVPQDVDEVDEADEGDEVDWTRSALCSTFVIKRGWMKLSHLHTLGVETS